jgi:hypothetical protein
MADRKKSTELQSKSRLDALKILREREVLPAPRKALTRSSKTSKERGVLVPPYPNANPLDFYRLYQWAKAEWGKLGRWQSLAVPVAVVVGLLSWEKELALREEYKTKAEINAAKRRVNEVISEIDIPKQKRKLFGFIPLPGR